MIGGLSLAEGEPYQHRHIEINNAVAVYIGIVGQIQGYVLIRVSEEKAKSLASLMMMSMPVDQIDDMAISALCELGNMIMGGASTNLAGQGITTDITTPTLLQGTVKIKQADLMPISVPLVDGDIRIVLDIAIKTCDSQ